MVFSPTMLHVVAAVATVSLHLNHALAEDMRYGPASQDFNKQLGPKRRLESFEYNDIKALNWYFGTKMETVLNKLPTQAEVSKIPWPGPRVFAYLDSINYRFNPDQPGPAEKYADAFGLNATDFMDRVSNDDGVDSFMGYSACTTDADCTDQSEETVCAKRPNRTSGFCAMTSFSLPTARARAARLEDEPKCPVVHNGVTFQPNELKALLAYMYMDVRRFEFIRFGTRFTTSDDNSTDKYDRPVDPVLRDLNPGFFHVVALNLLGIFDRSFEIDIMADAEAQNYPVRSFKVLNMTAMTLEGAAKKFYKEEKYLWNSEAASIVYVESTLTWTINTDTNGALVSPGLIEQYTEAENYCYLLELDVKGNVIGGEWIGRSTRVHPDVMSLVKAKPAPDTITGIGLKYSDLSMLVQKSQVC